MLVLDSGRSFREAAIKQRFFDHPSQTKTQSLQFQSGGLMWLGVQVAVYICFIGSFGPGGIWLRFEIDWGSSFSSLLTTVLKTCFSMMRGGGVSISRAKASQPEGLATKYVHLFITWFNWNVAWFCASHVAGSTQWFLYGMLRLNPFDCWSIFFGMVAFCFIFSVMVVFNQGCLFSIIYWVLLGQDLTNTTLPFFKKKHGQNQ